MNKQTSKEGFPGVPPGTPTLRAPLPARPAAVRKGIVGQQQEEDGLSARLVGRPRMAVEMHSRIVLFQGENVQHPPRVRKSGPTTGLKKLLPGFSCPAAERGRSRLRETVVQAPLPEESWADSG